MTNQEKYKQAFSVLHTSVDFNMEVEEMNQMKKKNKIKTVVASSVAACLVVAGSATATYAADIGGIQRAVQVWIHGDQTQVTVEFVGNGKYNIEYLDYEGNEKHLSGGGVAFKVIILFSISLSIF